VFRAHDYPLANFSLHSTTLTGRMGMAQEQRRLAFSVFKGLFMLLPRTQAW
jgi:hypothetical protein